MLSVALCTCNGEKYIIEQLNSIARQTVPVDEVVICDDASDDNTIKLIEQYSSLASFNIRLFKNKIALGSNRNFEKALSLCNGNIIFLCDQDDIWLPHRVESIKKYFTDNPNKHVVFSNAFIVNKQLEVQDDLWVAVKFNEIAQEQWKKGGALEYLIKEGNCVTGATMALRKEILSTVLPIDSMNHWLHDGIIALKSSLNNGIGFINDKLILYRQHDNQQIGVRKEKSIFKVILNKIRWWRWIKKDQYLETQLQDLFRIQHWILMRKNIHVDYIQQKIEHLQKRKEISERNLMLKFFPLMKEWIGGHYKKSLQYHNSKTWIYVIKDLIGS